MLIGIIVTIVGFMMLLDKIGIIGSYAWSFFWPILIIYIGLSLMYNKMKHEACHGGWCCSGHVHNEKEGKPKSPRRK